MSTAKEILDSIYGIVLLLTLIPALWIAGKIVLSQVPDFQGSQADSPLGLKHGTLVLFHRQFDAFKSNADVFHFQRIIKVKLVYTATSSRSFY